MAAAVITQAMLKQESSDERSQRKDVIVGYPLSLMRLRRDTWPNLPGDLLCDSCEPQWEHFGRLVSVFPSMPVGMTIHDDLLIYPIVTGMTKQ